MNTTTSLFITLFTITILAAAAHDPPSAGDMAKDCSKEIQGVMPCLGFAQGKQAAPSKECCDNTKDTKENKPKCLCYIMEQTHNGGSQFKSLGVQEAKLIQLPTTCQLKNASLSYCPGLLGLAPNSPDAAIFSNSSAATATPSTGTSTPLPGGGSRHGPFLAGSWGIAFVLVSSLIFGPAVQN
ncbi:Non-specific lipid transfer protein GPI-anchored 1 [Linum perenne]